LTKIVRQLRTVREQLKNRNELLKSNTKAGPLIQSSDALIQKLNSLEEQLHNPRAQIGYDILAQKGGAKLYSRMSAVFNFAMEGDGLPTQGTKEAFEEQKQQLDRYDEQWKQIVSSDLASLNQQAKALDVPVVIVP
jgi:hypothetical protein